MGAYDFYGSFCVCPPRRVYIGMRSRAGAETPSYPVTAYDVNLNSMGNAVDKASYISLWNNDPDNQVIGKLFGAGGPFSFFILVNSGQTPPLNVLGEYGSVPANMLPTANAGPDQTITLPTNTATLSGTGIDPDGTIVSYLWTKVSGPTGGTISAPSSAITGVSALQVGIYVYNLRVTDNNGGINDDTKILTVNPATFSFLTQPANQTIAEGDGVTISAVVQNGTANYVARWYKNGILALTQAAQSLTTVSTGFTAVDGDQFYVTATDSLGVVITSNTISVTVTPAVITITYGWSSNDPYINNTTEPTISNAATQSISHNSNLSKAFPSSAPDNYIVVKEPSTEAIKTSFNNGSNAFVGNTIPSTGSDEFQAPFIVAGFRYYVSRKPLGFNYTQPLNFLT